jgi:hypothetical protein
MSTRRRKIMFIGSKVRQVSKEDNLTAICEPDCLDNVGSLTSHNSIGLYGLLQRKLYFYFLICIYTSDRLCGLVVRVLGYRSGGPGSIPGTTRKTKVMRLKRGPLSLVSTAEELLDRKVAAPV